MGLFGSWTQWFLPSHLGTRLLDSHGPAGISGMITRCRGPELLSSISVC